MLTSPLRFAAEKPAETAPPKNGEDNRPAYMKVHDAAVAKGMLSYKDPATGYNVWTELYLKTRGSCCKSGCRHCPYGFKKP